MLTRIELSGFKTFDEFALDVPPFCVVFGPNGSGKSNLFDAIRLLSRLAETDLRTAVTGLRGKPHEIFRTEGNGAYASRFTIAAEVLLNPVVRDPWGAEVKLAYSRIRYEVEISRREDRRGIERLIVTREEAVPILAEEDRWLRPGAKLSPEFRRRHLRYGRRTPYLSTEKTNGQTTFAIRQDGHQGRNRPAEAAEATVLSSMTSVEFPHLYALREELRSWRFLQLDPAALRLPSPTIAAEELEPSGGNLATVLARLQAETSTQDRPRGVVDDIQADLAALIPGVVGLEVRTDIENRENRVEVVMKDSAAFPAAVVSDGTLRLLAVLTLLRDPSHRGLVYFEEPENGVSPFRLRSMTRRLRTLATDPRTTSGDGPLAQLLMNSHSPVLLSELRSGEMVFADVVSLIIPESRRVTRHTRIRPVRASDQHQLLSDSSDFVTRSEVDLYLATVDQAG